MRLRLQRVPRRRIRGVSGEPNKIAAAREQNDAS